MSICCCSTNPHVLRLIAGANGSHNLSNLIRVLDVESTPQMFVDAYADMARVYKYADPPRLLFAKSAFDTGGFFTPGLIVVGLKDSKAIAENLANVGGMALDNAIEAHLRRTRRRLTSREAFILCAVRMRIIAHELGHALIHAGVSAQYDDAEASADYIAGVLDGYRGEGIELGELLFWSIGCNGPSCTHPPPPARMGAYRAGCAAALAAQQGIPQASRAV
jgi:hypothetical protein